MHHPASIIGTKGAREEERAMARDEAHPATNDV